ncbi:MAG TPA: hypothetical protein VFK20_06505 [Vicinamibacterales bacterium]|nr:hypothetical protein [Vicinamibacterales bacterium]
MKRYTVGMVRERLAQALDEAEQGIPVFIERKGVSYRLSVERPNRRPRPKRARIDIMDAAVESGQWTWTATKGGLRFTRRRSS